MGLLWIQKAYTQQIPNYVPAIVNNTRIDFFTYTQSADTSFLIARYLINQNHPKAFLFLDKSIEAATKNKNSLGELKLKSLKAQAIRDKQGEIVKKKATVIKEYPDELPPPPPPPPIAPEVFHKNRIATSTNIDEIIESHWFLGNFYALPENKNLKLSINYFTDLKDIYAKQGDKIQVEKTAYKIAEIQIENTDFEAAKNTHLGIIDNIENESEKMKAYQRIGDYYFEKDVYINAMFFRELWLKKGKKEKNDTVIIDALNDIGEIFQVIGVKDKAFAHHQKALKIAEEKADSTRIVQSYVKLGIVNSGIKDYKNALSYFDKSLKIALNNNLNKELVAIYNQRADVFLNQKNPKAAIENIELCNKVLEQLGDNNGIILNLNIAGDINKKFGFAQEAKNNYQESLNLSLEEEKQSFLAMNYADYGLMLLTENKNKAAIDSCAKGYKLATNINYLEFIGNNCQCLYLANKKIGKFEDALKFHEQNIIIQDSLLNIAKIKEISKLQSVYTFDKQITEKDYSIKLLKEKNNTRSLQLSLLGLLALALLGGIGLFAINSRKQKNYNQQLSELNAELKNMNYVQLQNNIKLNEANQVLENFASVAAHDLKVPLRSIASFSELLLHRNEAKFDEKDKQYFNHIANDATRLQNMITALLEFSKIGKDVPPPEIVSLNAVANTVINSFQSKINETNAIITTSNLKPVFANKPLIEQVFQNLISNSLKFQPKHAFAKVHIDCADDEKNGFYKITITDNGIGIAKEHQTMVFELFNRINKRSLYEGNGIGLATCKRIVSHYGGEIGIESEINEGTSVWFTLPKINS